MKNPESEKKQKKITKRRSGEAEKDGQGTPTESGVCRLTAHERRRGEKFYRGRRHQKEEWNETQKPKIDEKETRKNSSMAKGYEICLKRNIKERAQGGGR